MIIGRTVRRVTPEEGWAAVSGVTAANDWGVYDLRTVDKGSNLRNKGGDGFTPLGPAVIPADTIDPSAFRVRTWVNGALVQDDTTADLLFPFGLLVADLSQLITLEPGDVILTGTPAGSSVAVPGDVVEVEVDTPTAPEAPTSGRLVSRVVEGTVAFADYGAKPVRRRPAAHRGLGRRAKAGVDAPAARADRRAARRCSAASPSRPSAQSCASAATRTPPSTESTRSRQGTRMLGVARTLRFVGSPARPVRVPRRRLQRPEARLRLPEARRGARDRGARRRHGRHRRRRSGPARPEPRARPASSPTARSATRPLSPQIGLPAFAQGTHPSVLGRRHVPWEVDTTMTCGGATVQPGDVVVGDDDGVVVIPPHLLDEVARAAAAQEAQDAWVAARVAEGHKVDGLFPPNAEWLARYRAEKARRMTQTRPTTCRPTPGET